MVNSYFIWMLLPDVTDIIWFFIVIFITSISTLLVSFPLGAVFNLTAGNGLTYFDNYKKTLRSLNIIIPIVLAIFIIIHWYFVGSVQREYTTILEIS